MLLILHPKMAPGRVVGSDIAHAVPLTLLAGAGHWYLGSVDWSLLGNLLIGSIPGIILGSYLATRARRRDTAGAGQRAGDRRRPIAGLNKQPPDVIGRRENAGG